MVEGVSFLPFDRGSDAEFELADFVAYFVSRQRGIEVVEYGRYFAAIGFVYCADAVREYHPCFPYGGARAEVYCEVVDTWVRSYDLERKTDAVFPHIWCYFFFGCSDDIVAEVVFVGFLWDLSQRREFFD